MLTKTCEVFLDEKTETHRAEVVCEMEQRAYMCHLLWAGDLSDLDGASPDQIHRPLHPCWT